MLQSGTAWLSSKSKAAAGVDVTYARTGEDPVELRAVLGNESAELVDGGEGPAIETASLDLLIEAADLVIGGDQTTPERGDRITITLGGAETIFRPATSAGEPEWRYADEYRTRIRLHCVEART